jgi:ParB family chromosome partitioning protein
MKSGLHFDYPIDDIKGADYNPRKIDDEAIDKLRHSLAVIGCAKPIIVRDKTIVAGHQRTRALRASGIKTAPVYLLPSKANTYDEVRFNQLHNGTDLDMGDENAVVVGGLEGVRGFVQVEPEKLLGNTKAKGANVRSEIMNLMFKYGPWGACVAGEDGKIFHAAQYALACMVLHKPCLVYVVPREVEAEARKLLGATYGVFSYDNLPRNTFIQTFAQMFRLRDGTKRSNCSPTYEDHVIPILVKEPGLRVLDFGCGQGDYVKQLASKGYKIQGVEFFRRAPGRDAIDVGAVNLMVDSLIRSLKTDGRFDVVICDYVLNSVDSQQAEEDVLNCLAAFCRPGGRVIFSGRTKERIEWQDRMTKSVRTTQQGRYVEFLDENGLTALYRKGEWFYQKFHSREDIIALAVRHGFEIVRHTKTSVGFQITAINKGHITKETAAEAIDREFNLPLNKQGRRLNRHEDVKSATLCLL